MHPCAGTGGAKLGTPRRRATVTLGCGGCPTAPGIAGRRGHAISAVCVARVARGPLPKVQAHAAMPPAPYRKVLLGCGRTRMTTCVCRVTRPSTSSGVSPSWKTISTTSFPRCRLRSSCRIREPALRRRRCRLVSRGYRMRVAKRIYVTAAHLHDHGRGRRPLRRARQQRRNMEKDLASLPVGVQGMRPGQVGCLSGTAAGKGWGGPAPRPVLGRQRGCPD